MKGPHLDWAAISPLVALTAGACLVLMAGLLRAAFVRTAHRAGAVDPDAPGSPPGSASGSGARTRR